MFNTLHYVWTMWACAMFLDIFFPLHVALGWFISIRSLVIIYRLELFHWSYKGNDKNTHLAIERFCILSNEGHSQ
jgi:hypothetical protein